MSDGSLLGGLAVSEVAQQRVVFRCDLCWTTVVGLESMAAHYEEHVPSDLLLRWEDGGLVVDPSEAIGG